MEFDTAQTAYNSARAAYLEAVAINNDELNTAISTFNTNSGSLSDQYGAAIAALNAFRQISGGTAENQ